MPARRSLSLAAVAIFVVAAQAAARSYRGRAFPDFSATDALTGRKFSLGDLRGKVVLVDFWATWCHPCVNELPNVARVYDRFHDDGLEIVSISLDSDRRRFENFARSNHMTWHHVMEGGGWKTRLAVKYGINGIPQMYVLDADGVCIAENVRGGRLEEAVRRGLASIKRADPPARTKTPDAAPGRPDRPDPKPAVAIKLVALRARLAAAAAPLEQLDGRLDALDAAIDDLQRQLPSPRDPAAAQRQVRQILEGLADARHAAFVTGMLEGRTPPAVPVDPIADPDDLRSWAQAIETLESVRDAVDELRAATGAIAGRLNVIEAEIGELERALSRGSADEQRVAAIETEIAAVAADLDDPWAAQIEAARRIVAGCCSPFDQAQTMLGAVNERIDAARSMLAASPDDAESLRALRSRFGSICDDLALVAAQIDPDRQAVESLPANPFEGRRLRDWRVLDEMPAQLDLAGAAVAGLQAELSARRERVAGLVERLVSLRQELSERLAAGDSADELREQFDEVTREVLALNDGVAR